MLDVTKDSFSKRKKSMIKSEFGICNMRGTVPALCVELEDILYTFMEMLNKGGMSNEDIRGMMLEIEKNATERYMNPEEEE